MIYTIFAVLLVLSNLFTFRFTARYIAKVIVKELNDSYEQHNLKHKERRSGYSHVDYRKESSKTIKEYIIENLDDAEHVLTILKESANKYGSVSVADYYDLIKVPSSLINNAYGWEMDTLSTANVIPVGHGYVINLPPVEDL